MQYNKSLSLREKVATENARGSATRYGLGNVFVGFIDFEQIKLDNATRPLEVREVLREKLEGDRVQLTVTAGQHRSSRWFPVEIREQVIIAFKANGITWFNNNGRLA